MDPEQSGTSLEFSHPPQTQIFPISSQSDEKNLIIPEHKYYILPPEGLALPLEITLPQTTLPLSDIKQTTHSLGMYPPSSWSGQKIINAMKKELKILGYKEHEGIWKRKHPVRLFSGEIRRTYTKIQLPDFIPSETISSQKNMMMKFIRSHEKMMDFFENILGISPQDVAKISKTQQAFHLFLTDLGYRIDSENNFYKRGGMILDEFLPFRDLVTSFTVVDFINSPKTIVINQSDLERLNITASYILTFFLQERMSTLDLFVQKLSELTKANFDVVKLALIIRQLKLTGPEKLAKILWAIIDIQDVPNLLKFIPNPLAYIHKRLMTKIRLIPREYEHREPLSEAAPQELTFKEAVVQGYDFTYDKYKEDIENMTGNVNIPPKRLKFLVKLLQNYPDMLDLFYSFKNLPTLTRDLISFYYEDPPDIIQELYSYSVNYPLIYPENQEERGRRQTIENLSKKYKSVLYLLYKTNNIKTILEMEQHPLELYLIALSDAKPQQIPKLVAMFGMMIPENITDRQIHQYILDKIILYKDVITRPRDIKPIYQSIKRLPNDLYELINDLKYYTDSEIINIFGRGGKFTDRGNLLRYVYDRINSENFMILDTYNPEITANVQTTLLEDIADLPKPNLVFGTIIRYFVIDLNELNTAFHKDEESFRFRKIYGRANEDYTITQVSSLREILSIMKTLNPQLSELIEQIQAKIRVGILEKTLDKMMVKTLISIVNHQSLETKDIIKDVFYRIFHMGMYMKGWLGPGNQYPGEGITHETRIIPTTKTFIALTDVFEDLGRLKRIDKTLIDNFNKLYLLNYNNKGEMTVYDENLKIDIVRIMSLFDLLSITIREYRFTQTSSRLLIFSAYYYLILIFDETIQDFDPSLFDPIV